MFGLPLVSPVHRWYRGWTTIIVLLDSTYTAFLVPILVGFQISDVTWTWGAYVDLAAGALTSRVRSGRFQALLHQARHQLDASAAAAQSALGQPAGSASPAVIGACGISLRRAPCAVFRKATAAACKGGDGRMRRRILLCRVLAGLPRGLCRRVQRPAQAHHGRRRNRALLCPQGPLPDRPAHGRRLGGPGAHIPQPRACMVPIAAAASGS